MGTLVSLTLGYVGAHYIPTGTAQVSNARYNGRSGANDSSDFFTFSNGNETIFTTGNPHNFILDTSRSYNLELKTTLLGTPELLSAQPIETQGVSE